MQSKISIKTLHLNVYNLFEWVRDHRVHHKYSESDADPHISNRGFFFSHMGWLMNSAAHLYGNKFYNKSMNPRKNLFVSIINAGKAHKDK
ncbi:stearoyl-CoA desaturase-like [Onthophagus taurus]|uniref:stearoyl-CoA desaturase-like n=1 Tax=Onthophagus taurus TaxID=166361 RepID=UPI0039BE1715